MCDEITCLIDSENAHKLSNLSEQIIQFGSTYDVKCDTIICWTDKWTNRTDKANVTRETYS